MRAGSGNFQIRTRRARTVITVDCRDIEAIRDELLIYVADNVGALPALKLHEFVLTPVDDSSPVDAGEVVSAVREYLDSIGEGRRFEVEARGDIVEVRSTDGKPIDREPRTGRIEGMFSCAHCGFVTRYEAEYHAHARIHYL